MKFNKGLIGAIAHCRNCGWRDEDYLSAQKTARGHAHKFNHHVICELTYATEYVPEHDEED